MKIQELSHPRAVRIWVEKFHRAKGASSLDLTRRERGIEVRRCKSKAAPAGLALEIFQLTIQSTNIENFLVESIDIVGRENDPK